jgi:hypothetical protein
MEVNLSTPTTNKKRLQILLTGDQQPYCGSHERPTAFAAVLLMAVFVPNALDVARQMNLELYHLQRVLYVQHVVMV